MTPEEQQILAFYASIIHNNIISSTLVVVTGFGVSTLGMFIAGHVLITKSLTRSKVVLLACLLITFIALTWTTICGVAIPLIQDQIVLVQIKSNVQGAVKPVAQILNKKILPLSFMDSWTFTISIVLNDCIVVWRAWILFQQQRLWRIALALLMIAYIGVQIVDCILDDIDINVLEASSLTILDWVTIVVSLVVNMFATGLIAWKAWDHYCAMKEGAFQRRTRVQNILLLLIESGAIYCTIQIVYVVILLLQTYEPRIGTLELAVPLLSGIFTFASAWYPIAVVILVNIDNTSVIESLHINQTLEGSRREGHIQSNYEGAYLE